MKQVVPLVLALAVAGCVVPEDTDVPEAVETESMITAPPSYNCLTREMWSAEKQAWCDRLEALKNATYTLPGLGDSGPLTLTLSEGRYEDAQAQQLVMFEELPSSIATAELADGTAVTTALLSHNTGGTGNFVHLAVMVGQPDSYENVATVMLGDRVQVRSVEIARNQLQVNLIVQAPGEPLCCPTLEVNQTYVLEDGELVLLATEELGSISLDPGRPSFQDIPLPESVLLGDDPRLVALDAYGYAPAEPVEGAFFEEAVLVERVPGRPVVFLTQSGLADDSVEAMRYRLEFVPEGDLWRLSWAGRQVRCYPGRGQEDWGTELCS